MIFSFINKQPLSKSLAALLLLICCLAAAWADKGANDGARNGLPSSEAAYAGLDEATISRIREDFTLATESMAATEEAIRTMDARFPGERKAWPPLARAYRASLEGLVGKHSPKLLEKFSRVQAAITDYEGLIEAHPESLELRFMRFAFYSQLPGLFGVGSLVDPDRSILVSMLERNNDPRVPDSQKRDMIAWILKEGKPDQAEARRLRAAVAGLDGD